MLHISLAITYFFDRYPPLFYFAIVHFLIPSDSKTFRLINGKSESLFLQRINPRKVHWTVVFRKMHKKGEQEQATKKRSKKSVKHQRAVVGATWEAIKAKRYVGLVLLFESLVYMVLVIKLLSATPSPNPSETKPQKSAQLNAKQQNAPKPKRKRLNKQRNALKKQRSPSLNQSKRYQSKLKRVRELACLKISREYK